MQKYLLKFNNFYFTHWRIQNMDRLWKYCQIEIQKRISF